ncbi:MAG: hypothetical protein WCA35_24035 [Kovacikia sp.]
MKTFSLILMLLIGTPSVSYAGTQCYYNGRAYQLGTILGPFVCTEQGWQKR